MADAAEKAKPLFNANDGITGRDGGPYLDKVEMHDAETRRAEVEGREPDYDNPGSTAGVQLQTSAQQMHGVGVNIPSQQGNAILDTNRLFDGAVADPESLLQSYGEIPAGALDAPKDEVEEVAETAGTKPSTTSVSTSTKK